MHNKRAAVCFSFLALLSLCGAAFAGREPVEVERSGNEVVVTIGGRPFTTYYFDPKIAKSYLQPLRSAQGTIVTRSYPVGDEVPIEHAHESDFEPHQRPLYFSHGDVDGLDFWSEEVFQKFYGHPGKQSYGRMVFQKIDEATGGPDSGTIRGQFDLVSPTSGRSPAKPRPSPFPATKSRGPLTASSLSSPTTAR